MRKVFLFMLMWAYISKALSAAYMNAMLTQIERQFSISTFIVGLINGSFEIGKPFVDCICELFWNETAQTYHDWCRMCGYGPRVFHNVITSFSHGQCVKEMKSLMWIYVLVGNIIRGMGETPIMPLGISYIEDFAKSENSPLYIGILEVGKIIGPIIGILLAPFCATLYVDIGSVNTDDLTITPTDTRWVGAWWIGFLFCAGLNFLTSIPFFFFPKTLPKEGLQDNVDGTENAREEKHTAKAKEEKRGFLKDFFLFMKSLFCNPIYMLCILTSVLQINGFVSIFTFKPKYLEHHYGRSTADAIFLIGLYTSLPVCIGCLISGFIMKKFKITLKKAAFIAFCLSMSECLLSLCNFMLSCDNIPIAGLTTSYEGIQQSFDMENKVLADCNTRCNCLTKAWDPVCGDNGLAYMSPCLAGCEKSVGTGINMVFQNCSCIRSSGNSSAVLGLCNKVPDCANNLQYFLIITAFCSFFYALALIPGYMVFLRSLKPEEKSLGVAVQAFCMRLFAGIPAPIYFGALIDRVCLHWGTQKCGAPGACRTYDVNSFSCNDSWISEVETPLSTQKNNMEEPEKKFAAHGVRCSAKIKMFLMALTLAYVSKSLSGTYMISMLIQIERQFGIPTSIVGLINGSFEIGLGGWDEESPNPSNRRGISPPGSGCRKPFVDYIRELFRNETAQTDHDWCWMCNYGPGLFHNITTSFPHGHDPRSCGLWASPTWAQHLSSSGYLNCDLRCVSTPWRPALSRRDEVWILVAQECVKEMKSLMWIYVLVGNIIRGIGETPIIPLGISYIEDFAKSENSPLYVGILETGKMIGPLIGLLLGSFCASIYVDTGSVNTDDLTITPTDTRWVGAWWIGFLVCAGANILTSIPFFFFPKTLPKEGLQDNGDGTENAREEKHREQAKEKNQGITKGKHGNFKLFGLDGSSPLETTNMIGNLTYPGLDFMKILNFFLFMKSLSRNPIYMLFILISVLQVNAFNTTFSFVPKFFEQQYGISIAETNFLMGLYTLPTICIGYLIAGFIMKKFKITVKKAAYLAFCVQKPLYMENNVLAACNTRCSCLRTHGIQCVETMA
ncbi:Solute carrier organic anion transporter family member 1A6 [Apodemus speciosus]|uniref:Solute carrier organic anion transporter family member 1A6 n=1 Tax=Apodemus speciosus TaxID=105296 RepID=A0ABQ0EXA0_APOSI